MSDCVVLFCVFCLIVEIVLDQYFYYNKINLPFPSWKFCIEETCPRVKILETNNLNLGNEESETLSELLLTF